MNGKNDRTILQSFSRKCRKTLKNSERNTGARVLGSDPTTGETVSVRIGRFGPMAQIGEGDTVRYAGLRKGQLMETISLEEALELFKFPRKLGNFEDKEISIGIGRFGPYIKHNNNFVSLKKEKTIPEPSHWIRLFNASWKNGRVTKTNKSRYLITV